MRNLQTIIRTTWRWRRDDDDNDEEEEKKKQGWVRTWLDWTTTTAYCRRSAVVNGEIAKQNNHNERGRPIRYMMLEKNNIFVLGLVRI